ERSLDAGVDDLRLRRDKFTFKLSVLQLPDRGSYVPDDRSMSDEADFWTVGSWAPQDHDGLE
ncbi:MAG: hypothetical protein KGL95_08535, partial [Patescibacteria group bacterium]|nr:hypothetical protein [Patescibacteria group bacterium]